MRASETRLFDPRLWPVFAQSIFVYACVASSVAAKDPADSVEFFENRIRPVLVEHCYQCHGNDADEIGGSLQLDSSDALRTGGDSGPAIIAGDPGASLLVSAMRYESSEMPPSGKLPDSVIQDFQDWIAAGAVDPRQSGTGSSRAPEVRAAMGIDLQEGRKFWAFQPIVNSQPPRGSNLRSRGPIDQYLNRELAAANLKPNGAASPSAQLRRLAFDLTGLPPSIELQNEWRADPSPVRWQRIVDSMLSSPAFAQHWARHWMDVARYADSNGSDFNATFHEAWRYRDYLFRSIATDRPFDQMIRQQIAGDLLPASSDSVRYQNLVASTFLMLGTKMLSERDKPKLELDVVDEQIDTIGRAFLGMTLGCARCHDHKFDPVPMDDYYALAGILKSTVTLKGESQEYVSTWNRVDLPISPEHRAALDQHQKTTESVQKSIRAIEAKLADLSPNPNETPAGIVIDDSQATKTGQWKESTYSKSFVGSGYVHDDNAGKGDAMIRFTAKLPHSGRYEVRVAYSPGPNRSARVPITIELGGGKSLNKVLDQRTIQIKPMWASLGTFDFDASDLAAVTIANVGTTGYVIADAVQFLSPDDRVAASDSNVDREKIRAVESELESWKAKLKSLQKEAPEEIPVAMAPSDRPAAEIADSHVHIRGDVDNLGEMVPRGFLRVCSQGDAAIVDPQGSGRLELAHWLTDPDHPLTARVFVNRVWMHLMGEGIVRTVDNLGLRGERPSHPELLDHLAGEFIREGWQSKPLIRRIVTSEAYRRSSEYRTESIEEDPENRLWWRMQRRRISAESIRDTMVWTTGNLDQTPTAKIMSSYKTLISDNQGGGAEVLEGVASAHQSINVPIIRSHVPPMLVALDAADPDLLVGKRPTTNVPGQALVLINSPDVNRWAGETADWIVAAAGDFDDRLKLAHQTCLQRIPTEDDRRLAEAFFEGSRESDKRWQEWIAALLASTEFRFLE